MSAYLIALIEACQFRPQSSTNSDSVSGRPVRGFAYISNSDWFFHNYKKKKQKFKLLNVDFGEVKRSSCHRNANLDDIYTQLRPFFASFLNKVEVSECRTPSDTNLTGGD